MRKSDDMQAKTLRVWVSRLSALGDFPFCGANANWVQPLESLTDRACTHIA